MGAVLLPELVNYESTVGIDLGRSWVVHGHPRPLLVEDGRDSVSPEVHDTSGSRMGSVVGPLSTTRWSVSR